MCGARVSERHVTAKDQIREEGQGKQVTGKGAWALINFDRGDDELAIDFDEGTMDDDFVAERRKALAVLDRKGGKGKLDDGQPEPRVKQDCIPPSLSPCPSLRPSLPSTPPHAIVHAHANMDDSLPQQHEMPALSLILLPRRLPAPSSTSYYAGSTSMRITSAATCTMSHML